LRAPSVVAPPASQASASTSADAADVSSRPPGERWTWGALGCWVGPPWAEALGAVGEERGLLTARRCRTVAHEALRVAENDGAALRAMADVEPATAARVADAIAAALPPGDGRPELLRVSAVACREAWVARRAAARLRTNGRDGDRVPDDLVATQALGHLAKLQRADIGPAAKLIVAVLAADRLEIARDLPARARLRATAVALGWVFGALPTSGEPTETSFLELLTAAATRGGRAPSFAVGAPLDEREAEAYASVAAALAARFDHMVATLGDGEASRVARGYALRLRQGLEVRRNRLSPSSSSSLSASLSARLTSPPALHSGLGESL
jgi:hypothetical protein